MHGIYTNYPSSDDPILTLQNTQIRVILSHIINSLSYFSHDAYALSLPLSVSNITSKYSSLFNTLYHGIWRDTVYVSHFMQGLLFSLQHIFSICLNIIKIDIPIPLSFSRISSHDAQYLFFFFHHIHTASYLYYCIFS